VRKGLELKTFANFRILRRSGPPSKGRGDLRYEDSVSRGETKEKQEEKRMEKEKAGET